MKDIDIILVSLLKKEIVSENNILNQLSFLLDRNTTVSSLKNQAYKFFCRKEKELNYSFCLDTEKIVQTTKKIENRNWYLEHQNRDGSIIAFKDGYRRFLKAGSYLLEERNNKQHIIFNSGGSFYKSGFFHVFGNYSDEVFPFQLCRIYFNLKPERIIDWMNQMLEILNPQNEYFHFKCIVEGKGERRVDNAILYVKREQFNELANRIATLTKSFVQNKSPLFTRCLAPGLAFAENPPDPNESFGTSRCRLIAEAIVEAHENGVADVKSYVLDYIEQKGYNLDKFYLNPGSRFEYDFSIFEK